MGLSALLDVDRYMHRLFSIGYMGSRKYVNEYYNEQDYADTDLEYQLKVILYIDSYIDSSNRTL